jgi:hypothetical protein
MEAVESFRAGRTGGNPLGARAAGPHSDLSLSSLSFSHRSHPPYPRKRKIKRKEKD